MAKNYKGYAYFQSRPEIVKIFDDLEAFHNFCRIELLPFDEAALYDRANPVWNQYFHSTRPRKPRTEYKGNNEYKKPQRN